MSVKSTSSEASGFYSFRYDPYSSFCRAQVPFPKVVRVEPPSGSHGKPFSSGSTGLDPSRVAASLGLNPAVVHIATQIIQTQPPEQAPLDSAPSLEQASEANKKVVGSAISGIRRTMSKCGRLDDATKLYTEALRGFGEYSSFDYSRLFGTYLCALLIDAKNQEDPLILQKRLTEANEVVDKAKSHGCERHCCNDPYVDDMLQQIQNLVMSPKDPSKNRFFNRQEYRFAKARTAYQKNLQSDRPPPAEVFQEYTGKLRDLIRESDDQGILRDIEREIQEMKKLVQSYGWRTRYMNFLLKEISKKINPS